MPGEFFNPTPEPEHRCQPPRDDLYRPPAERGWRCECGKAYVLEQLPERDVRHDMGEGSWQWRRSSGHDRGILRPDPTRPI